MKKQLFGLFALVLWATGVQAQRGEIYTDEESGIRAMLDHRKSLNFQKNRTVKAWSVQIMVTRDKYEANQKKYEVQRRYPEYQVDWFYEEPYYRLNVGAFYTKIEAAGLQSRLVTFYPDAYIFKNHRAKTTDFTGVSHSEE